MTSEEQLAAFLARYEEAVAESARSARYVTLFFLHGKDLHDPDGWLEGSGAQVRGIRLKSLAVLDEPAVRALIDEALDGAPVPIDPSAPRQLVIKSVSAKQRARRPRG